MLVLTEYIAKHEFKPLSRFLDIRDIISGAEKAIKGLAIEIKSPRQLTGCRFFKVRVGKNKGARMIIFVVTENKKAVPVLIRLKRDKIFGMNMSTNNPDVIVQINKNLDHVLEDIEKGRYRAV